LEYAQILFNFLIPIMITFIITSQTLNSFLRSIYLYHEKNNLFDSKATKSVELINDAYIQLYKIIIERAIINIISKFEFVLLQIKF